jgi:hypothetical protein
MHSECRPRSATILYEVREKLNGWIPMCLMTFVEDERLRSRLATLLGLSGAARRAAAPVVDLLVRLALAKAFFAPGNVPRHWCCRFPYGVADDQCAGGWTPHQSGSSRRPVGG